MKLNRLLNYISANDVAINESTDLELKIEEVIDIYNQIPVVETKLYFPADQVPICDLSSGDKLQYGVSADIFGLFMEKNEVTDVQDAISIIEQANQLERGSLVLVFEGDEVLAKAIDECRCCGDSKERVNRLKQITKTGGLLKQLKNYVPIAKEPSVTQVEWNPNTNIVNIDRSDHWFGQGFDNESFMNYNK